MIFVMTDGSDADLSQPTTWIFRISASYAGLNLRPSYEANRSRTAKLVSRSPKADTRSFSAWATFIMKLHLLYLIILQKLKVRGGY